MATTSFAAYASQYLTRQQQQQQGAPSGSTVMSASASQPMFFSFTTDNDEGSHRGGARDSDLDDFDDPHIGLSMGDSAPGTSRTQNLEQEQDDEDPYLRLDEEEEEQLGGGFRQHHQHQQQRESIPLLARSASPASPPGWLAHLAQSPPMRHAAASPSHNSDEESSASSPPPDLLVASPRGAGIHIQHAPPPPPPTQHNNYNRHGEPHSLSLSMSLTDSLLPRDGRARPLHVFTLPDPRHTPRKRRKHHDALYTSLFLSLLLLSLLLCFLLLVTTSRPRGIPAVILPYAIMIRTLPVLVVLTCVSAVAAYAHVWALRWFVRPVMAATEVFVPATLFVCALWAFVGSFMWDGEEEPTWGESVGLRLFSIIPLLLSLFTARRLLHLPKRMHTTSSTLTLATHILTLNPLLLALSPALLVGMLVLSIPFVTAVFRLLLIGYATGVDGKGGGVEWHVRAWANWAIAGVLAVWFWSWAVARGVLRTACASVVGAWYFADATLPPPSPTSTHTIHAALTRATGPSLGSIILASLILTLIRLLALLTLVLQRLPPLLLRIPWVPLAMPVALYVVPGVRVLAGWVEGWTERVSGYALVYVGLTGVPFWEGAGRGGGLVGSGRERVVGFGAEDESGTRGRNGRGRRQRGAEQQQQQQAQAQVGKTRFSAEPPLTLLTISPLTLTFPFALLTYLFVAHTLRAPHEALGAALLAGGVTAVVGLFCVGVVRDTADTLYMCYCIDKAEGVRRREEVFVAFEYGAPPPSGPGSAGMGTTGNVVPGLRGQGRGKRGGQQQQQQPQYQQQRPIPGSSQPETIVPRSPLAVRGSERLGVGVGSLFGVGARVDNEDESISEDEEEGGGGRRGTVRLPIGAALGHGQGKMKAKAAKGEDRKREKKKNEKKKSAPISPYSVGSDSEADDGRRPPLPQSQAYPQSYPHSQQEEDEDEEDLDPFKPSKPGARGAYPGIDEEALLEGLGGSGGGAAGGGYASTSPRSVASLHRKAVSSGGSGGFAGIDFGGAGVGVGAAPASGNTTATTTPGTIATIATAASATTLPGGARPGERTNAGAGAATGPLSGFTAARGALAAAHRERMMTSTQELNMKSQFLMHMRSSSSSSAAGNASGYGGHGAESAISAAAGGEAPESEGEESQLGPGSDFFK